MNGSCSQPARLGERHNPLPAVLEGIVQTPILQRPDAESLPPGAGRTHGALQAASSTGPFFFRVNVPVLSGHLEVIELFRLLQHSAICSALSETAFHYLS